MAFLRTPTTHEAGPIIDGDGLWLRPPVYTDYAAWADIRARSRGHLTPFEPLWGDEELARTSFRRRVRHYQREMRNDQGYAFFIFLNDEEMDGEDKLAGGITLSNLRRGVTQAITLGYWIGEPFAGQGIMSKAVKAVLPFIFDGLRLHRVEAACLQHNLPSIRVLESNGFKYEGLARKYLKIDGKWQDHLLYALLEDERSS